uniref:Uncharacterized protein n=1 Tax=Arundo donax TaxID=35708 RepID=A0A0A8YB76_ARUDO
MVSAKHEHILLQKIIMFQGSKEITSTH